MIYIMDIKQEYQKLQSENNVGRKTPINIPICLFEW